MRLIDADKLDEEVMHLFITISGNPKQHTVVNECKSSFRRMIDEQLTIEAQPVVHGEWIDNGIPDSMLSKCNMCGYPAGAYSFNFCPNCGARMKKEGSCSD